MRAARVDANQNDIVDAYRSLGFSVAITSRVGDGFPDIVVGKYGLSGLVEIKNPDKPPSERKLTQKQKQFHAAWLGDIRIVMTLNDVVEHNVSWNKKIKVAKYAE